MYSFLYPRKFQEAIDITLSKMPVTVEPQPSRKKRTTNSSSPKGGDQPKAKKKKKIQKQGQ